MARKWLFRSARSSNQRISWGRTPYSDSRAYRIHVIAAPPSSGMPTRLPRRPSGFWMPESLLTSVSAWQLKTHPGKTGIAVQRPWCSRSQMYSVSASSATSKGLSLTIIRNNSAIGIADGLRAIPSGFTLPSKRGWNFSAAPPPAKVNSRSAIVGSRKSVLDYSSLGTMSIDHGESRDLDHTVPVVKTRHLHQGDGGEVLAKDCRIGGADRLPV